MKDPNLKRTDPDLHPLLAVSGSAGVSGHSPVCLCLCGEKHSMKPSDDLAASAGDF